MEAEVRGRFAGYDVIFTGRLSKPALAGVLMQSDVCLYPCNFFETFCLTALECQAAGVPMVTSEFGALATTLAAGAGVKIPGHPNSSAYRRQFVRAAVDVLQDAERRRAMGAAGLAHVAGGPFGWLDVAEAVAAVGVGIARPCRLSSSSVTGVWRSGVCLTRWSVRPGR